MVKTLREIIYMFWSSKQFNKINLWRLWTEKKW